jgi:hypothetical protein
VSIEKVGSRAIAQRADLASYDFGFPAGVPAAVKLQQASGAKRTFSPWFSPLALATWRSLLPVFEANGLLVRDGEVDYLDLAKALDLMKSEVRWRDLKGNNVYPSGRSFLINTTDARKSNSGAMYLALASWVANNGAVIQSDADVAKVLPLTSRLLLRQGLQESSSAGPFEDYVAMGIGKAPLVLIYENQWIEFAASHANRSADMVLMYPKPTLFTKHVLVPFTESGVRLGTALSTDPELLQLATELGYRTSSTDAFQKFVSSRRIPVATNLVDVIDPPSYEMLERLIVDIEQLYK